MGGHSTSDFLEKVRTSLMLIDGEFGTFARVSEGFDFLINSGFIALGLMLFYILLSLMRNRNLGKMNRRSLVVFSGDPSEDLGSTLFFFYMWELCFSLVSPLWESCYSLASC